MIRTTVQKAIERAGNIDRAQRELEQALEHLSKASEAIMDVNINDGSIRSITAARENTTFARQCIERL